MSSADDILFEPIGTNRFKSGLDQQMIDAVKIALTGVSAIEFIVDPTIPVATYDAIADLIENDSQILVYTGQMVKRDSLALLRPKAALTIKDVFHRLHENKDEFFFCGRANGNGVSKQRFTNWFGVDSQIPIIHIDDLSGGSSYFEWWILGLMSQFGGYHEHYAFAENIDARKYYAVP